MYELFYQMFLERLTGSPAVKNTKSIIFRYSYGSRRRARWTDAFLLLSQHDGLYNSPHKIYVLFQKNLKYKHMISNSNLSSSVAIVFVYLYLCAIEKYYEWVKLLKHAKYIQNSIPSFLPVTSQSSPRFTCHINESWFSM